jgi:hypothetical protein
VRHQGLHLRDIFTVALVLFVKLDKLKNESAPVILELRHQQPSIMSGHFAILVCVSLLRESSTIALDNGCLRWSLRIRSGISDPSEVSILPDSSLGEGR